MTGVATLAGPSRTEYAPHPYVGGRTAVLRALAAWRSGRPGTARVVLLTGSPGSGRSHLLTGFLMLCEPEFRGRIALDALDPSTVPPDLPAPAVPGADGLTAAQLTWLIAEHYGLSATTTDEVYAELAALPGPFTVVVPDVDRAGPVRAADEPARVVRDVLRPLAAVEHVRLLADVPRHAAAELAAELNAQLPAGAVQIIDLDEPQWADPQGLVRQAEALLAQSPAGQALSGARPDNPEPAAAVARRAGTSPLVVELAVAGLTATPAGSGSGTGIEGGTGTGGATEPPPLPTTVAEALDSHAYRLGSDPQTLRHLLTPLAFAEGDGMPVDLWARLVSAVAGQDMSAAIAGAPALVGPFVQSRQEYGAGNVPTRTLVQLLHPAIGEAVRAGLRSVRATQSQIAMALLEAVPGQDWSKADPYVRDHIAGHTLEAGLLPQLLTDPGLFVHAHPTVLRAAVEAVPPEQLGEPARTYLRTVPLLTRTRAGARARAALLESAFVEDGLADYGAAVHRLGIPLPWQTLWSIRLPGISDVRLAGLTQRDAPPAPVVALTVPAGTPGARPLGTDDGAALLVYDLAHATAVPGAGPEHLVPHSEADRALAPLFLSRARDQVRIWSREQNSVVASLPSEVPFTGADLSPDGFLMVATEHGAKALRVRALGS